MEKTVFRQVKHGVFIAVLAGVLCALPASASRKVFLEWSPEPDPEVVGYVVYYGTASGEYTERAVIGCESSTVISDLTEKRTYYFAVTALSSSGLESAPSAEVAYDVPAIPSGSYHGLFYQGDEIHQSSSGTVSFSLTPSGAYSGQFQRGAARYPFSGKLNLQTYRAVKVIRPNGGRPMTMELNVGVGGMADEIYGYVSDGIWIAGLSGDRAVYNSLTNPAPCAGRYTFIVPGQEEDPAMPTGHGYGTLTVSAGGTVRFSAALADGAKVSQSVPVSRDGEWPLYTPLYSGKGLLIGWVDFLNAPESDVIATLNWIKQPNWQEKYYKKGFTYETSLIGSAFVAPASSTNYVLDYTAGALAFTGGNLDPGFTNLVVLEPKGKVSSPGSPGFIMSFTMTNGTFSGKVTDPANGKLRSFRGVVLQKINAAYGYLLATNQSSQVILTP